MTKPQAKIRIVTAEEARAILDRSETTKVRVTRQARVDHYAKQMQNGSWSVVGQGISLDKAGKLIDGFHRLSAIAQLGKGVEMLVVSGCDPSDTYKVDEGLRRTLTDFLKQQGKKNAVVLAAAIKVLFDHKTKQFVAAQSGGDRKTLKLMTIQDGLTVARAGGKLLETSVRKMCSMPATYRKIAPMGLLTFIHYKGSTLVGKGSTQEFFDDMVTGAELADTDPIHLLREGHHRDLMHNPGKRRPARVRSAILIKAWNAWLRGEEMTTLRWRAVGPAKEEFPTPVFAAAP